MSAARDVWKVFGCTPLRSGWIEAWWVNGFCLIEEPAFPQVRFEREQPLRVRVPDRVVSLVALVHTDGSRHTGRTPLRMEAVGPGA